MITYNVDAGDQVELGVEVGTIGDELMRNSFIPPLTGEEVASGTFVVVDDGEDIEEVVG